MAQPGSITEVISGLEHYVATDTVSDVDVQQVFAIAFRLYASCLTAGNMLRPFPVDSPATATDIVHVALQLLRSQNLEVFELAAWQSWGVEAWNDEVWQSLKRKNKEDV